MNTLQIYGYTVIAFFSIYLLVRCWRDSTNCVTPYHIFLLGIINFMGFGALSAADRGGMGLYSVITDSAVITLIFTTIALYGTMILVYHATFRVSGRVAQSVKLNFEASPPLAIGMAVLAVVTSILPFLVPRVVFVSQMLVAIGTTTMIACTVITLGLWIRSPLNALYALLAIGSVAFSATATAVGFGRSAQIAFMFSIGIVAYYQIFRNNNRVILLVGSLIFGALMLYIVTGLSLVRGQPLNLSSLSGFLSSGYLKISNALSSADFSIATQLLGGDTVDAALSIFYLKESSTFGERFHMVKWILANPIPREIFPGAKPEGLAYILPRFVGREGGGFSIGCSFVGHAWYDGGYYVCVIYGAAAGLFLRVGDEVVRRYSNNTILLGFFAAASANILMIVRGDSGLYILNVLMAAIIAFGVTKVLRTGLSLFGYNIDAVAYNPNPQLADPRYTDEYGEVLADGSYDDSREVSWNQR